MVTPLQMRLDKIRKITLRDFPPLFAPAAAGRSEIRFALFRFRGYAFFIIYFQYLSRLLTGIK
ncbi:MAG: hypothetical protein K8I30_03530, partial [Anaerolineae bacterium]|nr:hypothetical protein [Anaerolineae bacterium]